MYGFIRQTVIIICIDKYRNINAPSQEICYTTRDSAPFPDMFYNLFLLTYAGATRYEKRVTHDAARNITISFDKLVQLSILGLNYIYVKIIIIMSKNNFDRGDFGFYCLFVWTRPIVRKNMQNTFFFSR